ncbi:MAG TPA: hypothetical protein VLJ68_00140 [Chitinophagaceae bacterium]|nr:hypothetical protein [Chitinophagaceae bacterium]
MKKVTITILCFVFSISIKAQTIPKPAEVLDYLKKNIRIYYLAKPNTDTPYFNPITPESIAKSTNGIIFGTKSNNDMINSTSLLSDLFKTRSSAVKGGKGPLQDRTYMALKLIGKPIDLVFINDVTEELQPRFVGQYAFDTTSSDENSWSGLAAWPGNFAPYDSTMGGTMILGESLIMLSANEVFLDLVVAMGLRDYASMDVFLTYSYETGVTNPAAANPADRGNINYMYPVPDLRRIESRSINNALYFNYDPDSRKSAYRWLQNPNLLIQVIAYPQSGPNKKEKIPDAFNLFEQLKKENLLSQGKSLKSRSIDFGPNEALYWNLFPLGNLPLSYKMRNEVVLGLIGEQFIRKAGLQKFNEALIRDEKKLLNDPKGNKVALLIENMCMSFAEGKTLADMVSAPPAKKNYLFALALFDLFAEFPAKADGNLFNQLTGGTLPLELLNNYFVLVRDDLKKASDQAFAGSTGNKWDAATDAIYTLLNK